MRPRRPPGPPPPAHPWSRRPPAGPGRAAPAGPIPGCAPPPPRACAGQAPPPATRSHPARAASRSPGRARSAAARRAAAPARAARAPPPACQAAGCGRAACRRSRPTGRRKWLASAVSSCAPSPTGFPLPPAVTTTIGELRGETVTGNRNRMPRPGRPSSRRRPPQARDPRKALAMTRKEQGTRRIGRGWLAAAIGLAAAAVAAAMIGPVGALTAPPATSLRTATNPPHPRGASAQPRTPPR